MNSTGYNFEFGVMEIFEKHVTSQLGLPVSAPDKLKEDDPSQFKKDKQHREPSETTSCRLCQEPFEIEPSLDEMTMMEESEEAMKLLIKLEKDIVREYGLLFTKH